MLLPIYAPIQYPALIQEIEATPEGRAAMRDILRWEREHGLGEMDTLHGRIKLKTVSTAKPVPVRRVRARNEELPPAPCACCSNIFVATRSKQIYCSEKCRNRAQGRRRDAKRRQARKKARESQP